jgi:acetyl-CoA carboxylase biotin carboxyl carrier protein
MDLRKLKKLIDLVEESGIAELELTEGEEKVKICRHNQSSQAPMQYIQQPQQIMQPAQPAPSIQDANTDGVKTSAASGKQITSPMVGTFYRSSSPDAAPFVDIGTPIKKGDTLCIIEAMKILNEIESDQEGVIKKILIDNGQPVEFGEPLFIIE